jgi:predicted Fe-Mo cluster-binding NifX family protein
LPTDDRRTLAAHFGRAAEFAIFEGHKNDARLLEFRANEHEHDGHAEGAGGAAGEHSHDFDGPLKGVHVVICRGMGRRAQEALAAMKIQAVFAAGDDLEDLVRRFTRGDLAAGEPACGCDHDHG